jgi:hypothetical protein
MAHVPTSDTPSGDDVLSHAQLALEIAIAHRSGVTAVFGVLALVAMAFRQ